MIIDSVRPSLVSGYARCAADAVYPSLWRGLERANAPFLGPRKHRVLVANQANYMLPDYSENKTHSESIVQNGKPIYRIVPQMGWTWEAETYGNSSNASDTFFPNPNNWTIMAWLNNRIASHGSYWLRYNTTQTVLGLYMLDAAGPPYKLQVMSRDIAGANKAMEHLPALVQYNSYICIARMQHDTKQLFDSWLWGWQNNHRSYRSVATGTNGFSTAGSNGKWWPYLNRWGAFYEWSRALTDGEVSRLLQDPMALFRRRIPRSYYEKRITTPLEPLRQLDTAAVGAISLAGTDEVSVTLDPKYRYKVIHTGVNEAGNDNASSACSAWISTVSNTITCDKTVEDDKLEIPDGGSETVGPGVSKLYLKTTANGDAVMKFVRIGKPTSSY